MDSLKLAPVYGFFLLIIMLIEVTNGDVDDWVDPKDMLRYNSMTQTMSKYKKIHVDERTADDMDAAQFYFSSRCNPLSNPCADVKRCCPPCSATSLPIRSSKKNDGDESNRCRESLFVIRYVKRLLHIFDNLNGERSTSFKVDVTLTQHDLDVFKRYVTSKGSVQDVEEILSRMMTDVNRSSWIKEMQDVLVFQEWISFLQKNILYVVSFTGIILIVRSMLKNKWYVSLFQLLFVLYAISIVWELQHQYLKADAMKKMSRQQFSEIPKECNPDLLSYWEYFLSSFNNRCQEYYEATVDSQWEVNPFMAAMSVLTRTFPLFGTGLGESIADFYKGIRSNFSFWELFIMFPLGTVILIIIIMYPCTSGLTSYITAAQPVVRQMVEDVDKTRQQQQLPQSSSEIRVVEQHHHHYHVQSANIEESLMVSSSERIRQIHCNCSSVEDVELSNESSDLTTQLSENGESSQSYNCDEHLEEKEKTKSS